MKLITGGLALAVLAAGSGLAFAMRDDSPPPVQVRLATAQRGTVTSTVTAAGNTADGSRRDLAFGTPGTVTKVYVKVGAHVRKGQVLARTDSRAARESYTAAEADVSAAREALDNACSSTAGGALGPSSPPQTEHPTQPPTLAPTDEPEPQPTVTVTVTATETVTVTATPKPSATGRPTPTGKPTPKPSGTAKPAVRPSGKPSTRPSGKPSARPSGQQPTGCAKGALTPDQAQANLDRAESAREQAADQVRGAKIVAPASGTVLSLAAGAGDASGSGTFVSLGDLNELQVEAMVTESDVNRLKLGQHAQVTLATSPSDARRATVTRIAPTATVSDQLVRYSVTLSFDAPPKGLMLGQTAAVSITTGTAEDAVYVPAQAVHPRQDGSSEVTVRAAGRDTARAVRTGVRSDQYVQITDGLADGDQVVLRSGTSGEFPDGSWPD
ncbi:efflux RND transporter periplasmic adaptor subunit [Nonomuraea sediminis]|uniref:efflux RND transporter periplasmic adaptor subunit n=1 Tax=Nonomuraea sediminis TaxID=2835864 RepID=UPI001BDBD668|nr:efflux RND transporter periplasmic adaptor subunit [Nonomuraea sediminis]